MTVFDIIEKKKSKEKISMVTCYDYWSARILNQTDIEVLLVGDSLAMVVYGHSTTLPATVEMMSRHTEAVARGAGKKFIVSDLPFLSFRKGIPAAMDAVHDLMVSGAQAVKLEGVDGHEKTIEHIVKSGVPVMGHIGLTPQSVHALGGHKVQGKSQFQSAELIRQAKTLEDLGCFSIVLECVPESVGKKITEETTIPTIGIGAGAHTDGQVLVLQDLLGTNSNFSPKFLRKYEDMETAILEAVNKYVQDIQKGNFPSLEESYIFDIQQGEVEKFYKPIHKSEILES